jgi:acetyl esterase/lipase
MNELNEIPRVYNSWLHPQKSWKDILISWIVSYVLPLRGVSPDQQQQQQQQKHNNNKVHIQHAQSMRASIFKMIEDILRKPNSPFRTWWKRWGNADWVRVSVPIQRNKALLEAWGIWDPTRDETSNSSVELPPDKIIHVMLTFPVTILRENINKDNLVRNKDYGWLELQEEDSILEKISKEVPIILYFHGGGMTLGHPNAADIVEIIQRMDPPNPDSKDHPRTHSSSSIILAGVQYSLAPEHPFPAAPIDAISVVSTLLDQERTIHIAGVSAGGNLAIVSGLEALRAHPLATSHIRSIFVACPMILPAADSISMYQNSMSSYISPEFLRWCYRVYLELPAVDCNHNPAQESTSVLKDILEKNSNRMAWDDSKWKRSSLCRLAEPTVDVPSMKDWSGKIIVTTNAGDPLLCDGLALVHSLRKNGAHVSHHAHMGSHWFGTLLDEKNLLNLSAEWREIIFA